jgi:hypothetical protein
MSKNGIEINQEYLDSKNKSLEEFIRRTLSLEDLEMEAKLDAILDDIALALEGTYKKAFIAGIKSINHRKQRASELSSLGR